MRHLASLALTPHEGLPTPERASQAPLGCLSSQLQYLSSEWQHRQCYYRSYTNKKNIQERRGADQVPGGSSAERGLARCSWQVPGGSSAELLGARGTVPAVGSLSHVLVNRGSLAAPLDERGGLRLGVGLPLLGRLLHLFVLSLLVLPRATIQFFRPPPLFWPALGAAGTIVRRGTGARRLAKRQLHGGIVRTGSFILVFVVRVELLEPRAGAAAKFRL